ncbi:MAG: DUF423 domain-containing protein [Alphaproteobacteria bacterium]|nr:DUF423 domain-containing protein [Alphaproteobacteria bacterium]
MKILWLIMGVFGCAAIILGALGAHVLKDPPGGEIAAFETGVRYHLIHAIAAGLALVLAERAGGLAVAAACVFLVSIVCFSGSIYLGVLADTRIPVAPVGGVGFISGWLLLGVAGWRATSKH